MKSFTDFHNPRAEEPEGEEKDVMTPSKYFKLARKLFVEAADWQFHRDERLELYAKATAAASIGTLAASLPAAVWFEGDDDGNQ
jgi:hypothetical protein